MYRRELPDFDFLWSVKKRIINTVPLPSCKVFFLTLSWFVEAFTLNTVP